MPVTLPVAVQPVALLFTINNRMVARGLDGLSDEETWHQVEGKGNPVAWILGHITETRTQLLALLGAPWDAGFGGAFARGAARTDRGTYPACASILAKWVESEARLAAALEGLTDETLAAAPPVTFGGAKTIADLLAFFAFHEAYHLGQIGFIRKHLGHSSLAG